MIISRNNSIALIDSGVGGLALLKSLRAKFPKENYIYFADNEYMPYGNKSKSFIKKRVLEITKYLINNYDIKLIILACNTASVSAYEYLSKQVNCPIMGLNLQDLNIQDYVILCTKLSAKGYSNLNVKPINFAKVVENDYFNKPRLIKQLEKIMQNNIYQNVVLGCTHYELVANLFEKVCPNTNFIKPCEVFIETIKIPHNTNSKAGDILMLASLPTKSYIDKLWKIVNN